MTTLKTEIKFTLYHYWRSSCSWRVRWALNHKGIAYADRAINLLQNEQNSPDFLAKNPGGYVPAVEFDGEVFGESLAILEWIEETHPASPLLPKSPADRLRVRQMCHVIASGIQPIQNLAVMRRHSSDASEQAKWASHWIATGLEKFEALITPYADQFCFGGALSFADLCLVPQVHNAIRFNVSLLPYPVLARINAHCLTLPACIASAPQNQPGAS